MYFYCKVNLLCMLFASFLLLGVLSFLKFLHSTFLLVENRDIWSTWNPKLH